MIHENTYTANKLWFLFVCCCVLTVNLSAQSYSFKNYTTNDGLVQTDITDIKQDKGGNIWIGTNGGGLICGDRDNLKTIP